MGRIEIHIYRHPEKSGNEDRARCRLIGSQQACTLFDVDIDHLQIQVDFVCPQ